MCESFEKFWESYPKRTPHQNPKAPAKKAFIKQVKRGINSEEIIEGAVAYKQYCDAYVRDRKYVAQAVTFLNQERWQDFEKTPTIPTMADIVKELK